MPRFHIRRLSRSDDRSGFSSGNLALDHFFRRYAGQNQFKHHIGTTYVAVEESSVLGFVTILPSAIEATSLPKRLEKRLPSYPLPVLRLARMAVDERAQGRGVGLALLKMVFTLTVTMAEELGALGVVVDAKPDAVPFYERYGFLRLDTKKGQLGDRPEPLPMFLPLSRIPVSRP